MITNSEAGEELALPEQKALLARRLVCDGRAVGPGDFEARGLRLTAAEVRELERWLAARPSLTIHARHAAADGAERLVLALPDRARAASPTRADSRIETVVMPDGAVCVSTQAGCAVGCRFCASGRDGLERNLTAAEIVEQFVIARRVRPIRRVVYMGIGEPSHNLDNVLEACVTLARDAQIPARRQTFSTVGAPRVFARLAAAECKPSLAVSLHTTDPHKRRALLPGAYHDVPIAELVDAAEDYGAVTGIPVMYAWTLLATINDTDAELEALVALMRGRSGYLNLIPWNEVEGMPFAAPARTRALEFARTLRAAGVFATLRHSTGADARAACGQLRG